MLSPSPLIVDPQTNQLIVPQTPDGVLRLEQNQVVALHCSSDFIAPLNNTRVQVLATCENGEEVKVNGRLIRLSSFRCQKDSIETLARRTSNDEICARDVTHVEVGLQGSNGLINTMYICHDETIESTHFVHYSAGPGSMATKRSPHIPPFRTGSYYHGRNVRQLYSIDHQRKIIRDIIGVGNEDIIKVSENWYFVPSQLAARSEFIYDSQQKTTFYFINTAPQWQSILVGNWRHIVYGVQNYVSKNSIDVDIYTGTFGVYEIANDQDIRQPIYLAVDEATGKGVIPVPKFFYKIMVEKITKKGIAFVIVNDPHADQYDIDHYYQLCEDISHKVNYMEWDQEQFGMGFSFACDVNDLALGVAHLPFSLRTTGLLL